MVNNEERVNYAVLSKNYRVHLEAAADKSGLITFYSNFHWTKASDCFNGQDSMSIYFKAGDGTGMVEYEGTITKICLDPVRGSSEVEDMLRHCPDDGVQEEFEKERIKTLYSVKGLKKLVTPFPQTRLLKADSGKPVSEKYDRGYCIVNELTQ